MNRSVRFMGSRLADCRHESAIWLPVVSGVS
jgi:hypothetical protein